MVGVNSLNCRAKDFCEGKKIHFAFLREKSISAVAFVEHTGLPLGAQGGLLPRRLSHLYASERNTLQSLSWLLIWARF